MNHPTLKLHDILAFEMKDAQTEEGIKRITLGSYTEQELAGFSVCVVNLKQEGHGIDWSVLKYSGKDMVFFTDDSQVDLPQAMRRVVLNILCYLPLYEPVPGFTHELVNELPSELIGVESIPTENVQFIKVHYQSTLSKTNLRDAHLD